MALYSAIDLHSNNSYLAILDDDFQSVFHGRLPNDLEVILAALRPYRADLTGVAVESTYNWYWLVDGLMDNDYRTHLVNTSAVVQYKGLKYSDDDHDARWLARLLKLGILPEGYIYPRENRGTRDLLRRRSLLVRKRTDLLLSSKMVYACQTGQRVTTNEVKKWKAQEVARQFEDECLALSIGSCVAVIETLTEQILRIEKYVLKRAKLREPFGLLKGVGGIGDILALTIMYEIGEIGRFAAVGDFASYSRCVDSTRWSNGKKKGKGNVKNGNPHLSWAFTEAAHGALRFEPLAKRWYDRKVANRKPVVALRAVATKLARACYHVLRDGVPFEAARAFS